MKTIKKSIIAILVTLASTITLSSCFVDADEEVFDQLETTNTDSNNTDSNEDRWGD